MVPRGLGSALKPATELIALARKPFAGGTLDNLLRHGVGALHIDAARMDHGEGLGRWPSNALHDGSAGVIEAFGAAARFFCAAKPSRQDRVVQCVLCCKRSFGRPTCRCAADHGAGYPPPRSHPTVKPIDLVAWLCRLITPPGGTVLDPFAGSGTLAPAAAREGFDCILIEREAPFVGDILHRVAQLERAA